MSDSAILDLEALERAPLRRDPCDFVVVPGFVRAEARDAVNRDYPDIDRPGNFEPEGLRYGPAFEALLAELHGEALRARMAAKFGLDLASFPLQMTVRRFAETSDGHVHNDSRGKIVTALIYFNEEWKQEGGRLRLLRSSRDIEDYAAEVPPCGGTLLAFRRSEHSYHGFKRCEGERRSLQMYWVKPKRAERGEKRRGSLRRRLKRLFKRG